MNRPIVGTKPKKVDVDFEHSGQVDDFYKNMDEHGNIILKVGDYVDFVYGAAAYISEINGDINPDDAFLYHYKK